MRQDKITVIKIISGGQTGVDRAALDVAIALHLSHGGWCPKGRLAEDGMIDKKYLLKETTSSEYSERTKLNIRDSDATLIIVRVLPVESAGTQLTLRELQKKNKLHFVFELSKSKNVDAMVEWVKHHSIKVLNIAGPRESQCPGIYQSSRVLLERLLKSL